jgi:hypothetical protein
MTQQICNNFKTLINQQHKMKKLIFALSLLVSTAIFAQSTTPKFGTTPGTDNTFRKLNNGYTLFTDVAGNDAATIAPKYFNNVYKVVLLDSFTFSNPTVTSSSVCDNITIICTAASGTPKLKFTGSNWITAGTATLSTGLRAVITFVFDGAKWVERSRVVQ